MDITRFVDSVRVFLESPSTHQTLAVLGNGLLALLLVLGIGLTALLLYFLPSVVAASRHKRNTGAIFVLNLLLGWCLIGWVIALVWACCADMAIPVRVVQHADA